MVSSVKNRITKWKILFLFSKKYFVVIYFPLLHSIVAVKADVSVSIRIIEGKKKEEKKRMKTKDLHQWDNLNLLSM